MKRAAVAIAATLLAAAAAHAQPEFVVPKGTIIAFAELINGKECPDGWDAYARGMILIGAGIVPETNPDIVIKVGDEGGHSMHQHIVTSPEGNIYSGDDKPKASAEPHSHKTEPTNHLPPYIGVQFCIYRGP